MRHNSTSEYLFKENENTTQKDNVPQPCVHYSWNLKVISFYDTQESCSMLGSCVYHVDQMDIGFEEAVVEFDLAT